MTNTITNDVHSISTTNPSGAGRLNWAVPSLLPGATYSVRVKATQCGVEGNFGAACFITIAGPEAQSDDVALAMRNLTESSFRLFPNPMIGSEVRLEINGLGEDSGEVLIQVFSLSGKRIFIDNFGHRGEQLNRLIRFDENLAAGLYMVQIIIDGQRFSTERLVVK